MHVLGRETAPWPISLQLRRSTDGADRQARSDQDAVVGITTSRGGQRRPEMGPPQDRAARMSSHAPREGLQTIITKS